MTDRCRDRILLIVVEISVDFTKHTLQSSAHEHEQDKQRIRENCNRHSQGLERSQLFYRGRDRATQLVVGEVSVDFTKHTMLASAHKHEQRDSANDRIVIVTYKPESAVNCPIKVAIVPFSWIFWMFLMISQSTHCCYQNTNTNRETAQTLSLVLQGRH